MKNEPVEADERVSDILGVPYPENIMPNPIWKDRALCFFWIGRPNDKRKKNNL